MNPRRLLTAVLLLTVGLAPAGAHNVAPDPVVDVFVKPAGGHLTIELRLPVAVLTDANLPRDIDGRFAQDKIAPALELVGRSLAQDLELQQGDEFLAMPAVSASLSPDEGTVLVNLDYVIHPDDAQTSARFHAYRAGGLSVRTEAHYNNEGQPTRTFTIAGDPERVIFEPATKDVAVAFLRRGTNLLLSTSDYFLFALCLIAPPRRTVVLVRACGSFLAGQAIAILFVGFSWVTLTPPAVLGVQAVAASAIVIAAIQDLVSPDSRWLWPLALIFGVANGLSVGGSFLSESAFAGAHLPAGLFIWLLAVEIGIAWVMAVLASAAALLRRRGAAAQIVVLAVSIVAGHASLHRLVDRAQELADLGTVTLDRFLMILVLAWACVVLCAAIAETMIAMAPGTGRRASPVHARTGDLE